MKAVIISVESCQKCKMLNMACPDVDKVEMNPVDLLNFARAADIKSMPFVVLTGEINELEKVIKSVDKL